MHRSSYLALSTLLLSLTLTASTVIVPATARAAVQAPGGDWRGGYHGSITGTRRRSWCARPVVYCLPRPAS